MSIYKVEGEKKDGKLLYRVRVNYTDRAGKPHQAERRVYGKPEAQRMEIQLQQDYSGAAAASPSSKITVAELYAQYKEAQRHEVRESSLETNNHKMLAGVLPYLGDKRIDRLTPQDLQAWKQAVGEKGVSLRTKRNYYGALRALLNFAVKMELIPKTP